MVKKRHSRAEDIAAFTALVALADAGYLDQFEFETIRNLALEDGVIDEAERTVLRGIFNKLPKSKIAPQTWKDLQAFRKRFRI